MSRDEKHWAEVFSAHIRALRPEEAEYWQDEIILEFAPIGDKAELNQQVIDAVRKIAKSLPPDRLKIAVTVQDVIQEVRRIRSMPSPSRPDHWKERMREATADGRWEIICEPNDVEECREREQYARGLPGGFKPFKAPESPADLINFKTRRGNERLR